MTSSSFCTCLAKKEVYHEPHPVKDQTLAVLLIHSEIATSQFLPGQNVKVLSERNPVEDEGLVELSIHDGLLQDLACLLVHQVSAGCIDGESQECQGVSIRVEEDIGMRAAATQTLTFFIS